PMRSRSVLSAASVPIIAASALGTRLLIRVTVRTRATRDRNIVVGIIGASQRLYSDVRVIQKAQLKRAIHRSAPGVHVELAVGVLDVRRHRVLGNPEAVGDERIGQAAREEIQHLNLAWGQGFGDHLPLFFLSWRRSWLSS